MSAAECINLVNAAKAGDVDKVRTLLQQGKCHVNYSDSFSYTPLHYACLYGHLNVVRVLMAEFKANLNIQYTRGFTLLHHVCEKGHADVARALVLEFKADLSIQNDVGRTPLMLAARNGHEDVVLALLRDCQCPVIGRDTNGWGVIHHACALGSVMAVRTLIKKHMADINALTNVEETPLYVALYNEKVDVVFLLIIEFGCDPNVVNQFGKTPLHYACERGDVHLVKALIYKHKARINAFSKLVGTPLHVATRAGEYEVFLFLMNDPSCDPYMKDQEGQTVIGRDTNGWGVIHHACALGSVMAVRTLIKKHMADINALTNVEETPLYVALYNEKVDVVFLLIIEFGCDPNVVNQFGKTPLHYACERGDVHLVKALIYKHKARINAFSKLVGTPLHVATRAGEYEVFLFLMNDPSCDPYMKDQEGQTLLHLACESGNINLVNSLLHMHEMGVNALNEHKDTPLHVAVSHNQHKAFRANEYDIPQILMSNHYNTYWRGQTLQVALASNQHEVALALVKEHGCDITTLDRNGQTVLHLACKAGNIDLVNTLLHTHKMNVNALTLHKETPLHVAVTSNHHQVALALVKEHGCDTTALDRHGWTVLHVACKQGAIDLVHVLIRDMTDINVSTNENDTPLHVAAWGGHYDVVLALVSDARCDHSARNSLERTALHVAASQGHHKIVQELLKFTSPLVVDKFGDTPLHLAPGCYRKVSTVQCLLHDNAPVLLRNANGSTPRDLAWGECGRILEEYIRVNRKRLHSHYIKVLELAEEKYSGSHWMTRIFVVGNSGAGKSSFIESLKREGFFESFSKVSESSVPPHTAGIIPSVHMSSQYGRVLFYDFAGDVEYYSSHAAIFESLASSRKGDNIFIIVVDLREDNETIKTTLHYWFSFIQYQNFSRSSFIVVGGHLDQSVEQSGCLDEFCTAMQPNVHNIKHFMLDCRDPRSSQIAQVKKQIFTWVSESQKYELSSEARLVLGLLEKDFSAVPACPVQTLVSHTKDSEGWLPVEPKSLHQILLELHEVGILLLLGDCTKDTDHVILNISQLTNDVHKILFATSAFANIQENFNVGILPDSILKDVLPQYITKECLIHLQYCQEICHTEVDLFPSLKLTGSTSQSFLFFPALCSADKGELPWDESTGHSFSIGWLALCTDLHDYFPPRFLHVLLLRLVHRFTLSVPAQLQTAHASPEHSRRCTMWKKGVYWLMEEGVDCMVEVVKGNKGVVVLLKSSQGGEDDCVRVFTKVVSCVMEAKAEFCHSIKPRFFLLDSSAEADYLNEDHQFAMSDVEKALNDSEGKRVVISVLGRRKMDLSSLQWILTLTHWNTFFPITGHEVLRILEKASDKIFELGLCLGASWAFLEALKTDFPSNVNQRRLGLVSWWMKSSSIPPCWYTLVEALTDIERQVLADKIRDKHGLHIQLQEKLLSKKTEAEKPDKEFLHSLSGVVGSRWPSLAVSLALTEREIEELKERGFSQEQLALQMLKIWASKEEATYGQLYRQLKTISLFQYSS